MNKLSRITATTSTKMLIVVASVIVMFLPALSVTAASESMKTGNMIQGEIVAAEYSHRAETITVRSDEIGQYPNDSMNIFLSPSTKINVCSEKEPFKGLAAGREATVMFHELGGVAVADSVSEQC